MLYQEEEGLIHSDSKIKKYITTYYKICSYHLIITIW
jgi:hypothetical protein